MLVFQAPILTTNFFFDQGKTFDRPELSSLKPTPKMRAKGNVRPRPKTIHIDSGSVQIAEGMSSRGKKGSTSNLTGESFIPCPYFQYVNYQFVKIRTLCAFDLVLFFENLFCMPVNYSFYAAYAPSSTMKRDYYRGSQDSLADRSMSSGMLYKGVFCLFSVLFINCFV